MSGRRATHGHARVIERGQPNIRGVVQESATGTAPSAATARDAERHHRLLIGSLDEHDAAMPGVAPASYSGRTADASRHRVPGRRQSAACRAPGTHRTCASAYRSMNADASSWHDAGFIHGHDQAAAQVHARHRLQAEADRLRNRLDHRRPPPDDSSLRLRRTRRAAIRGSS